MKKHKEREFTPFGPISKRIKAFMDVLGLNRNELSRATGIANETIYRCFSGKRKWNLDHLELVASALGTTVAHLVQDTIMVSQAGGVREGQGPPHQQILRPAPDHEGRPFRLKEDTKTLAKMYEIVVEDQSLMPHYPSGTIFTAQRETSDLIKNGNLVVYWSEDEKTHIRQIFIGQDHVVLKSLTQGIPDKILPIKLVSSCDKIIRTDSA